MMLQPVFRGGLGCWNFVQRGQETRAAAAFGHLFHAGPTAKLLGQSRRHDRLDGNLLPRSQIRDPAVIAGVECLPPSLAGKRYYQPTDHGVEKRIGERLEEVRKAREAARARGEE